nr:hypothetical protein Iba_chr15bCG5930 [Ipomoea batatas]
MSHPPPRSGPICYIRRCPELRRRSAATKALPVSDRDHEKSVRERVLTRPLNPRGRQTLPPPLKPPAQLFPAPRLPLRQMPRSVFPRPAAQGRRSESKDILRALGAGAWRRSRPRESHKRTDDEYEVDGSEYNIRKVLKLVWWLALNLMKCCTPRGQLLPQGRWRLCSTEFVSHPMGRILGYSSLDSNLCLSQP